MVWLSKNDKRPGFTVNATVLYFSLIIFITLISSYFFRDFTHARIWLYFIITVLFLKRIVKSECCWFKHLRLVYKIGIVYFIAHPIIIIFLSVYGFLGYRDDLDILKIIFPAAHIVLQFIIVVYVATKFRYKDYIFIFKLIAYICFFLFFEFLTVKLLLDDSLSFSYFGHFESYFINAQWLVAFFALIAYFYFFSNYLHTRKKIYLIGSMVLSILVVSTLLRNAWLSMIIFTVLSSIFTTSGIFRVRLISSLFILIIFTVIILAIGAPLENDYSSPYNLYARLFLYANKLDLFIQYFPLGLGGGGSGKYFFYSNPIILTHLENITYLDSDTLFNLAKDKYHNYGSHASSSHNTFLDIIADYGALGLFFVVWLLYIPLKILVYWSSKSVRNINKIQILRRSAIAVISLTVFSFFLSIGSYLWLFMFMFVFMLHLEKEVKNSVVKQKNAILPKINTQ
jgi:hypothetical protein